MKYIGYLIETPEDWKPNDWRDNPEQAVAVGALTPPTTINDALNFAAGFNAGELALRAKGGATHLWMTVLAENKIPKVGQKIRVFDAKEVEA